MGATHTYPLVLGADVFLHLEVEQFGSDVSLDVSGPAAPWMPPIDSFSNTTPIEPLFLVTAEAGEVRLEIRAETSGSYEIRLDSPRRPTPEDYQQFKAHRAFYEARTRRKKTPKQAGTLYREAIATWRELGDRLQEARALYELAEILKGTSDSWKERLDTYERARELFEQLEDRYQQARCLQRLGGLWSGRNELWKAQDYYARSLVHWRALENSKQASFLAFDQAYIERQLGRPEAARKLLHEALDFARQSQDLIHEAKVRTQLGALYYYRGENARGIREHQSALGILERLPTESRVKRQRAATLTSLGPKLAAGDEGKAHLEEALELLHEARRLRLELGDRRGLATAVNNLGLIHERMNHPRAALEAYEEALEIYRDTGRQEQMAVVMGNRCKALTGIGQLDLAWDCYREVLPITQLAGYQNAEAQILYGLTDIAYRRGELTAARRWIERALEVVELIRDETELDDLRSTSMVRGHNYYKLAIEIALALHQHQPEAGYADRAFLDLEKSRARGLLEVLVRLRPELEFPPHLRALQAKIHRLKIESLRPQEQTLRELEQELEVHLEQLYMARPRYSFVAPPILSAPDVQELLDSDTLLLAYHLGERQSAVWAITNTEIVWRPLAPRAEIEHVARALHTALANGAHPIRSRNVEPLSRELSQLILAPVADLLERPRLAIVPEGALRYVSFAALPHPRERSDDEGLSPLLFDHRITSTPSASVVAALRTLKADRPRPPRLLALLADPVLRVDDKRLVSRILPSPARGETGNVRPRPTFPIKELPYAAEEAAAILGLVKGEEVLAATGFAANRDFVMGGALSKYRILHFATHGHLDDSHGELSGLFLAQYDAEGQAIDGFLWAYDLYQLDLNAELVVLSACATALGEDVRGEGLIGLTRGFFYAGAERLLVSLWNVDDQATARLMEFFYRGLLHRKLQPAEALRQAQLELRREGWRAPYYWAPFVLQGDWDEESLVIGRRASTQKNLPLP